MLKLLCIGPRPVVNSTPAAAKALCAAGIVPDEDGSKLDYLRARMAQYHAGSEALNLGKCWSTIVDLNVPWKATTLEQRGDRVHRIDGTAAKYEVINLVLTGTLEHELLAMVERKADLQDAILGESGGRTRTTGGKGRNFFEQALESWSDHPD